ncbi:itaconate CoA-transferase [Nocardioides zeae]|uniref:Itaconate CoA-transferase n=1 Tax=Nocardioides zeae TaxID=1457234 RepID=A0ACC6IER8_9ACTN|nr:CaiB/BaiF CoA-transferase family protein [Nocardioides zeae]MDR6174195.1 itaconate CoA-transferase [Nocardioides zeae]MDR6209002.1 itaconate CoA-transferase [Nocardioides zeae]
MSSLPLDGVLVVAIEQAVAAPLATRSLADLGARVIKVERPPAGDLARGYDHLVHGTGAHFVWLNRGKESLAVDLKVPAGRDAVRRLIDRADVVVQNLAPGAAVRLGLDPETLRADRPELVVGSITGYGAGGSMRDRKAYDMLIQAEAGLMSLTGTPETPVKTGIPASDIASGVHLAQGVLAALVRRLRTGEGATIEVSMLEATVEWVSHALYAQLATGAQPPRMSTGHASIAPYDAYPTRDGELLIGVQSENGWTALCRVLGLEHLGPDPRFATNVARVQHRDACDALVAGRTRRWLTADLDAALARAGVPAAQVRRMDHVVAHPQLRERDRWRTVRTPHASVPALLPPVTFADAEAAMGDVPALGSHTVDLLLEAGLDGSAVDGLVATGAALQAASPRPDRRSRSSRPS